MPLWEDGVRTSKVWFGLNALLRSSNNTLYEGGAENGDTNIAYNAKDGSYALKNNTVVRIEDILNEGAINCLNFSAISADTQFIRGIVSDIEVESFIDSDDAVIYRCDNISVPVVSAIFSYSLDQVILTEVVNLVVQVFHDTNYIYVTATTGIFVYLKSDLSLFSYVALPSTVKSAAHSTHVYLASTAGVYEIAISDLNIAGDRTSFLALKFHTASVPAIQSNSVTCMSGSGAALLIGTTAGLDYIIDTEGTTVRAMTQASVTDCSIKGFYIAYVLGGEAFTRGLPPANFTHSAADLSGLHPIIGHNPPVAPFDTNTLSYFGLCGGGEFYYEITINQLDMYSVDAGNKIVFETTQAIGDTWYPKTAPIVVGEYMYIYGHQYSNSGLTCKVYKRSGNAWVNIYSEVPLNSTSNSSRLYVSPVGNQCIGYTDMGRSVSDGNTTWYEQLWHRYVNNGSDVYSRYQTWFPDNMGSTVKAWTPNGSYLMVKASSSSNNSTPVLDCFVNVSTGDFITYWSPKKASPSVIKFINATEFVTFETVNDLLYLCWYSLSGTSVTFIASFLLGAETNDEQTERYSHSLNALGGYPVVFYGKSSYVGNYPLELVQARVFILDGSDIVETQCEITFAGNYDITWASSVAEVGSHILAVVSDYDIPGQTSMASHLNILDTDAGNAKSYTTANVVEVQTDVFIGTDAGVIAERQANKLTRKMLNKLAAVTNVTALAPSGSAGKHNGYVVFGTDDLVNEAYVGVESLED